MRKFCFVPPVLSFIGASCVSCGVDTVSSNALSMNHGLCEAWQRVWKIDLLKRRLSTYKQNPHIVFTCAYCALEGVSATSSPENGNPQCSVFCSCFENVIVLTCCAVRRFSRDRQTERSLNSGLCICPITNRNICILTVSADSSFRKDNYSHN